MSVSFNGKKGKRNAIMSVQRNLKHMEEQAKLFMEKHNKNLPPICTARHYLYHSLKKKEVKENDACVSLPEHKEGKGKMIANKSVVFNNDESFSPPTVYNLEFRNYASLNSESPSGKVLMNSTSLRMKMNEDWKKNKKKSRYDLHEESSKTSLSLSKSKDKIAHVILNSKHDELKGGSVMRTNSNKMFTPRMTKTDLSKRQAQILQKYYNRFIDKKPKQVKKQKQEKETNLASLIGYATISTERYSQEQELISTRNNLGIFKSIENPEMTQTKKKIHLSQDKKQAPKKRRRQLKNTNDVEELKYTPWQNNGGNAFEDMLGINKF